jgi:hypothetical protein
MLGAGRRQLLFLFSSQPKGFHPLISYPFSSSAKWGHYSPYQVLWGLAMKHEWPALCWSECRAGKLGLQGLASSVPSSGAETCFFLASQVSTHESTVPPDTRDPFQPGTQMALPSWCGQSHRLHSLLSFPSSSSKPGLKKDPWIGLRAHMILDVELCPHVYFSAVRNNCFHQILREIMYLHHPS